MVVRYVLFSLALGACALTAEERFTKGRALDPCLQAIPACPGIYAGCVLDDTRYTEKAFPGSLSFIVKADPNSEIEVLLLFRDPQDAGLETLIYWNEPGCSDVYVYDSQGRNILLEADDDAVFSQRQPILEGGEHLVEIISDMQARVLIAVDVHEP